MSAIPNSCRGEVCTLCKGQAYRKIEEVPLDPGCSGVARGLSAYVCVEHYRAIFQPYRTQGDPNPEDPITALVADLRRHADADNWATGQPEAVTPVLERAATVIEALVEESADLTATFNLQWKADMRAIKAWQAATGKELTWPDSARLSVWLLEKLDKHVSGWENHP